MPQLLCYISILCTFACGILLKLFIRVKYVRHLCLSNLHYEVNKIKFVFFE